MMNHGKEKNIRDNKEHYRVYVQQLSVANDQQHIQIVDTKQSVHRLSDEFVHRRLQLLDFFSFDRQVKEQLQV